MRSILASTALLLVLAGPSATAAFRIAAIYPAATPQPSVGNEAICITRGLVQEVPDVTVDIFANQRNATTAVEAAEQIIAGKYDVAIGTFSSSEAIPAADLFEKAGIPFFVPTASHEDVTRGKNLILRIPFNDRRQARLLASFAVSELKPKIVAVVKNISQPNSESLGDQFAREVREKPGSRSVHLFEIISGEDRYAEIVTKLLAVRPDLVFLPLSSIPAAKIYAELGRRGASVALLGADSIGGRTEFFDAVGATSPQLKFYFVKHWNEKLEGPASAHYRRIFEKHCVNSAHSMVTASVYDTVSLLLKAHGARKTARGKDLIALARRTPFEGLTGRLVYGPDNDPLKSLQLFRIEANASSFWKAFP